MRARAALSRIRRRARWWPDNRRGGQQGRRHPQTGTFSRRGAASRVEVLIALVVLSIGMLRIAALYLETLRANRTALYRTQAVALAADLADRIRVNRDQPGAYACAAPCVPGGSVDAVANDDLTQWVGLVQAQLPGGAAAVTYLNDGVDNTPDVYTIDVWWTEVGQATPVTYQLRMEI